MKDCGKKYQGRDITQMRDQQSVSETGERPD